MNNPLPAKEKLFGFTYQMEEDVMAYYFLMVSQVKEVLLWRKLAKDEAFTLADFGTLVASGYGTPPEAVKQA